MSDMIPKSAPDILRRTLYIVRIRANADGECFGSEIVDAMREAGLELGFDRVEVLLTRNVLLRAMETVGKPYPAELAQDFQTRIPVSEALKYLSEAIRSADLKDSGGNAISVFIESQ